MTWDSVPWFVGGGAEHSPEVARLLAYAGTSGAEGIIAPGDLKVTPTAVPSNSVRVLAGACLIQSDAAGGAQQTYVGRNVSEDVVQLAATGSGAGRSDLIVARVEDPFMAGEPYSNPANPKVGPYIFTRVIPNVSPTTTVAPAGSSAIALARVDIPANTGTITAGMIRDLRRIAQPRRQRHVSSWVPPSPPSQYPNFGLNNRGLFPSMQQPVDCPSWATQMTLVVTVNGLLFWDKVFTGNMRAEYGWNLPGNPYVSTPATGLQFQDPGSLYRGTVAMAGTMTIPPEFRGKTHFVRIGTLIDYGTGAPIADKWSNVTVDAEFVEVAE